MLFLLNAIFKSVASFSSSSTSKIVYLESFINAAFSSNLRSGRQFQPKRAAMAISRLDADVSIHALYRFAHDCQPNARAFIAGARMSALERFKNSGLQTLRDTNAIVFNEEPHRRVTVFGPDA